MVSLARVLAAEPGVILVDELSQGLAPIIVKRLLAALREAADAGAAVLLVEQHIRVALSIADRAYLMRSGQIQEESSSAALRSDSDIIRSAYL
jgi:branched-chain amino acid transport system ATP-binding protein